MKKYTITTFITYILLTIGVLSFTGCQSAARQSEHPEHQQPSDVSQSDEVHSSYQQALTGIHEHDSLHSAYTYLQKMKQMDMDRSWLNAETMRVNFLIATYTDISEDSSKVLYNEGQQAAFNLIQENDQVASYLRDGEGSIDSLVSMYGSGIHPEPLYYWALNDLFWLRSEQPITRLVSRKRVERAIKLLRETHPEYRWAAVKRLEGMLLTISPDGDLNDAKQAFEQAINEGNGFLENRYFYGRFYGVLLQDKDLFMDQMNEILLAQNTSTGDNDIGSLNTLVKKRAEQLKDRTEQFFFSMR